MFIIQKEVIEFNNDWSAWKPKYSLLISSEYWIDIARDIMKDYPKWMLFNNISDISWWYLSSDGCSITVDDAEEYSRCQVETPSRWITYRWKEYNVESNYLFFNLFE